MTMWTNLDRETELLDEIVLDQYEKRELYRSFLAYLRSIPPRRLKTVSEDLIDWYRENKSSLGMSIPAIDEALKGKRARGSGVSSFPRVQIKDVGNPFEPSHFELRIRWMTGLLRLEATDAAIFAAVARASEIADYDDLALSVPENSAASVSSASESYIDRLLALKPGTTRKAVDDGTLGITGLVMREEEDQRSLSLSNLASKVLMSDTADPEKLVEILLGKHPGAKLDLTDFQHLGESGRACEKLLAGAYERGDTAVSILLHGGVGTGKTEYAKAVAEANGVRAVFVGELGESDYEPTRADRLAHLAFIGAVAAKSGRILLVVDEADDIFAGIGGRTQNDRAGSKVFLNRVVEDTPAPTLWITNYPRKVGQSVVRRMTHAVEFSQPDFKRRLTMVRKHVEDLGASFDEDTMSVLASVRASPALLASSVRSSKIAGAGGEHAVVALRSLMRAMGSTQRLDRPKSNPFIQELANTDIDLNAFVDRIKKATTPRLSFLFSGPPGTGKTALCEHLAEVMGIEVLEKSGSDLLGKYVGETEKAIRSAFDEAADTEKFLVFNEVDSMLADRSKAERNWEVGMVNELLQCMERHPQPFAATTNFADNLDRACFRRFMFKVKFEAMTAAQITLAYRTAFGRDAPIHVVRLDNVTSGDIDVVARKVEVLGITDDAEIATMLMAEISGKPGASRPIGFGV